MLFLRNTQTQKPRKKRLISFTKYKILNYAQDANFHKQNENVEEQFGCKYLQLITQRTNLPNT